MIEEKTKMNSSTHQGNTQGAGQNPSSPEAADRNVSVQFFSSLLPKVVSAVRHPPVDSDHTPRSPEDKPDLEQLQTELRVLKDQFEQMKSQHNKEIKLLMNELDEEKRIRLTLQMDIQRMKKHMAK